MRRTHARDVKDWVLSVSFQSLSNEFSNASMFRKLPNSSSRPFPSLVQVLYAFSHFPAVLISSLSDSTAERRSIRRKISELEEETDTLRRKLTSVQAAVAGNPIFVSKTSTSETALPSSVSLSNPYKASTNEDLAKIGLDGSVATGSNQDTTTCAVTEPKFFTPPSSRNLKGLQLEPKATEDLFSL